MTSYNLAFLGYGNVNRSLVRLLEDRAQELRDRHGITYRITGIASRRLGWISNPEGLNVESLCGAGTPAREMPKTAQESASDNVRNWLAASEADILFEATSLNVKDGQPAVDHIRAALEHGAHAITANKGPIVYAYRELRDLAAKQGKRFLLRIHRHGRRPDFSLSSTRCLAIRASKGFHGILNSTTNVILSEMENGLELRGCP